MSPKVHSFGEQMVTLAWMDAEIDGVIMVVGVGSGFLSSKVWKDDLA